MYNFYKKGFTLAEVLITLAIIGVIATLTLPALMTNIKEQQAITAFKKAVNTLVTADEMNTAKQGWGYDGIKDNNTTELYDENGNTYPSMYAILKENTNLVKYGKTRDYFKSVPAPAFFIKIDGKSSGGGSSMTNIAFFRDGTALLLMGYNTEISSGRAGFAGVIDVNGVKGPNMLSNCNGENTSRISRIAYNDDINSNDYINPDNCNDKSKRVIKDRFPIVFTFKGILPGSDAAAWALSQ